MAIDERDLVWRQVSRIATCMVITRDGGTIRAAPMIGTADRLNHTIWFVCPGSQQDHGDRVTGDEGRKDRGRGGRGAGETVADRRVCLAYVDTASSTYVTVSGCATVVDDRETLRKLARPSAGAFSAGEEPEVRLVAVRPETAEIWDEPGSDLVTALRTLTAKDDDDDDEPPAIGERRTVSMVAMEGSGG